MSRIFISYKRVDKEKVFIIKDQIESALGEKCWIDLDGIESDALFKNVIIRAINECEIVLFMYSKAHSKIVDFEKDWTVRELNFAEKKNKRIVFINLDGSPLTDVFEFDYGTKQHIDGNSYLSICSLCNDITKWIGNGYANKEIFSQNENRKEIKATHSGLQYKIIYEGTGKRPNAKDKVLCHYEGSFINGEVFDSSYIRCLPAEFYLQQVIEGLSEGIQLMKEGARYKFYIPSKLAYGQGGAGKIIPPNTDLIYDIKLMSVL